MYGFNPWVDQIDQVNLLVSKSGETESIVLRKLLDEALTARRRKAMDEELEAAGPEHHTVADSLQRIEVLLTRLLQQGDTSYRMHDVALALVQDTLAEARAGRNLIWKQMAPALKEQGLNAKEVAKKFEEDTDEGKDFAYGAAQDLKKQQES
jgi:hypothetical protein